MQIRCIELMEKGNAQALEQRGSRWINARFRSGHAKALLAQHSRQRRHRRSSDSDHVDVFWFAHAVTAASRISSPPVSDARSLARTPSGIVSIGREVCPTGAPNTIGTPKAFMIRWETSTSAGLPA